MTPEQIRNSWDDDEPSTPQEPRGAILPAAEPARGFSDADLLRRRTAALDRVAAENERLRAEVERLREDDTDRPDWDAKVAMAQSLAFEASRAAAAEAKLRDVGALHVRTSTDGHGPDFCKGCSDAAQEWVKWPCPTAAVLARSQAPQAPAEQEGE